MALKLLSQALVAFFLLAFQFVAYGGQAKGLATRFSEELLASEYAEGTELNEGDSPDLLPPALAQLLRKKHFVFVDGIANELASLIGNYFYDNMALLRKNGITVTHRRFPSRHSVPRNAADLEAHLHKIYRRYQKPMIVIGHSMGGAEVVYAVLKDSDWLLSGKVEKVVAINPAIGGSELAEQLGGTVTSRLVRAYLGEGLESLKPDPARRQFIKVFNKFRARLTETFGPDLAREQYAAISKKVFYVRTERAPDKSLSWGLQCVLYLCQPGLTSTFPIPEERDDGLLRVKDQMLKITPRFGTPLDTLVADHIELVISGFASNSTPLFRKAFTKALLLTLYETEVDLE